MIIRCTSIYGVGLARRIAHHVCYIVDTYKYIISFCTMYGVDGV